MCVSPLLTCTELAVCIIPLFVEGLDIAQRVVALDTKYHSSRPLPNQHRMLYLRRRNQLLQENAKFSEDASIRESYLQQRSVILASKYGLLDRKCVCVCVCV